VPFKKLIRSIRLSILLESWGPKAVKKIEPTVVNTPGNPPKVSIKFFIPFKVDSVALLILIKASSLIKDE